MNVSTLHDPDSRGFASDNYAGAHPEILAALAGANGGHQISYGEDVYTARLQEVHGRPPRRRTSRSSRCSTAPARTCCRCSRCSPRWGAVICAETAHIHTDENGAPGAGRRAQAADGADPGRQAHPRADRPAGLRAGATSTARSRWPSRSPRPPNSAPPTPPTRSGRSPTTSTRSGMRLHLDGARIANAAASLDLPLRAFTTDAGVDVLSLRRHQERPAVRRGRRRAAAGGVAPG